MIDRARTPCRHSNRMVAAVLDGTETSADRMHAATCAACTNEVRRARSFERALARASAEAGDTMPEQASLPATNPFGGSRAIRLALRLVTMGGAIVAGLFIATLIGPAIPPSSTEGAFLTDAAAQAGLAPLELPCREGRDAVVCELATNDHTHRVNLILEDDAVVEVIATIANTDGTTLPRSGGDALFRQVAAAVLVPGAAAAADAWLQDAYPNCRATCSAALDGVSLSMTADRTSVTLTLRDR
jgi:hypothetical protein